jgi:electron transport complex protein RnfD
METKTLPAPFIREKTSRAQEMQSVVVALSPAFLASLYFFGLNALIVTAACTISAVLCEELILRVQKKPVTPADRGSALITGILLAFCVTPLLPWWMAVLGSIFAIAIAKHAFGGLGHNIFNPALIGRAFLLASFPVAMTTWAIPFSAVTGATILNKITPATATHWQMFLGNRAGSIGETSILALLIGAAYLVWKGTIELRTPLAFIGTVFLISAIFGHDPLTQVMAGGLILGAFFMATDPVTRPVTKIGRWLFGIGAGILTIVIRFWGGYPEGVCYAILIMNAFTPLLDSHTQSRRFGQNR